MPKRLEGDFDYIVIGAGTAGCIVANRLSADPANRVLILEAGGNDNWIWFHIPVGYLFAIGNPRSDWMFKTEPEPGLNGRSLAYPRGKVIGGSSAINAMISMRGQAADYDHWRQLGLGGWGWDDVLPAFRRLEDHFLGESAHHGVGGGWRIEAPRLSWTVLDAVGAAAEEMGIRKIPDFNTGDNEGVGYFHVNQKRGRRWSSARGFLKPALHRPNLRLETNVLADRLILEQGRAVGVRFFQNGEMVEARASGEVILCAGSIGSVQVLHRSGVGPADWLAPLGIEVVLDRQGVGRNLQDHLQQRAIYRVDGVRSSGFSRARIRTANAPTSSSTSSRCRSTSSEIRCTASPRSRSAPAICSRPRAASCAFDLRRPTRRLRSRRIICRPAKTARSPPTPSAPRGG
jgi:choline dehydrogenase